jgi:hypothetical protein
MNGAGSPTFAPEAPRRGLASLVGKRDRDRPNPSSHALLGANIPTGGPSADQSCRATRSRRLRYAAANVANGADAIGHFHRTSTFLARPHRSFDTLVDATDARKIRALKVLDDLAAETEDFLIQLLHGMPVALALSP